MNIYEWVYTIYDYTYSIDEYESMMDEYALMVDEYILKMDESCHLTYIAYQPRWNMSSLMNLDLLEEN